MKDIPSPQWFWLNGALVPASQARLRVEERGLQFAESLYEVVAVVRGKPFRLADHVERMQRGARELGLERGVPPLFSWQRLVEELWAKEPHEEAILYAQVTGGAAPREHLPTTPGHPTFFAYLRRFTFPSPSQCAQGVAAITVPETRWARRDLKTTMLLPAILAKKLARERQAAEAIFVGQDGYVNEGASSNVCLVVNGKVVSPPPGERLLEGITLKVVAELCRQLGIPFTRRWVSVGELKRAQEVFITSTTTLVMPVVQLDGQLLGDGKPGPLSLRLVSHFQKVFRGQEASLALQPF